MIKIATWNVNSLRVRLPQLLEWLAVAQPDIVALQETKVEDKDFPIDELLQAGYQTIFCGQKSYNGVATLSRLPATEITRAIPTLEDPQCRVLAATAHDIRVINLYVPNGSSVGSEKYEYKLNWLHHLQDYLSNELKTHQKIVVLGDFNIAPEDKDVHDPKAWEGNVLVSPPERQALKNIIDLGFHDSFRLFESEPGHYSWWDYRAAGFRRNLGLRIDHILITEALRQTCKSCAIDKQPRSNERPSDHTPVIACFEV